MGGSSRSAAKAVAFKELPAPGDPVILPNAWDPVSANVPRVRRGVRRWEDPRATAENGIRVDSSEQINRNSVLEQPQCHSRCLSGAARGVRATKDRKSTRLNSSHV